MKKITILALHLGYGGIEKAISSLANMLCTNYEVKIVSTYKMYDKPAFNIDERVKIIYLLNSKPNKKEVLLALKKLNLITALKEGLKSINILYQKRKKMIDYIKKDNSDIIISTRAIHNRWSGKYASNQALKIAWEHSHHNNNKLYINNLVNSCNNLDYLVCVSQELAIFYKKYLLNKKTEAIYIPLSLDNIPSTVSKLSSKQIISIGRFSKEKGYDDLIEVFKLLNIKHPKWQLNIVGDGLEKEKIIQLIEKYQLRDKVILHGYREKEYINNLLKKSSIYIMTSISESFGLVLLEAMSYGIPCIAFDSARGPSEIIDNNKNGYLVSNRDKKEMVQRVSDIIDNKQLRKEMGKNAYEKALMFTTDKAKEKWLAILQK